ncbi:glycosyltransferase [Anaerophaga thermohalophila]|uniref:glycosyltransferase family protein n=1 Tax=Anaerophaga thermohalophila TaxID=177400 RepID=UPI000237D1B0|nr:glycosyltransferase [Anaerophaga thermohalophila]MDI3521462.1 spore maturation protein CgeB [Anaerophaga sp.]
MTIRFLKISSYYRGFLNHYYGKYPEVKSLSYREQYDHLMGQYFAWSDNYGRLLAQKGMETMEVVANAESLQRAWALENNISPDASADAILEAQINYFKPEIIYFQDSVTFNGSFIDMLKKKHSQIRLCIGNLCAPFSPAQVNAFQTFDFFTVCSPFFQQQLKKYNIDSVVIPHAFDHRILDKIDRDNPFPEVPFVFIGSIFADEGFHSTRRQVLEQLINDDIPIAFYGNLPDRSLTALLKRQASFIAARTLDNFGLHKLTDAIKVIRKGRNHEKMPRRLMLSKKLYDRARPPVFGLDMFKALSRAKIGFNIHIDCAGDYAANMRLFETTGVGTCLVTDYKSNISDFFRIDEEVVTYKTPNECVEKIKWLMNNPDECEKIAKRGQRRTLQSHSFESRIELFHQYLMSRLR